ncbi:MAG TPA: M20/M25/M40 family metallo-hydrolase [Anaerovoracaceae bacterium]|nr:M20/M25/M40 family metallo-hydrolase [Anaerovoracaceae bacterium]
MDIEKYYEDPVLLAQKLIQFNTTNISEKEIKDTPEEPCSLFIKSLFDNLNVETEMLYSKKEGSEKRPNLLAKLYGNGDGSMPPLLLYGHLDVVSTEGQKWEEDPFAGVIKNGYLWGRGAIDMKGEHAIFLVALFRIIKSGVKLPYDIYYMAVSDEEASGSYGVKALVEEKPEIFDSIRYAFGEIGGFSLFMLDKKFYPIQIAEKQVTRMRVTAHGEAGHASMKVSDSAVGKLSKAMNLLTTKSMPVRVTKPVELMINGLSDGIGGAKGKLLKQLLVPSRTDFILKKLGKAGELFFPLLHNSINITILGGGTAINVVPSEVWFEADMRMVPECTIEDGIKDIKDIIGDDFDIDIKMYDEGAKEVDMTLYEGLAKMIKEHDEEAIPIPFVLAAVTDGRFLQRLGIQSYGYTPMQFPKDYSFTTLSHNANERIPVDALVFGVNALYDYLTKQYEREF